MGHIWGFRLFIGTRVNTHCHKGLTPKRGLELNVHSMKSLNFEFLRPMKSLNDIAEMR